MKESDIKKNMSNPQKLKVGIILYPSIAYYHD